MSTLPTDPEQLFVHLQAKGGRPAKLRNLSRLQELCREQSASGSRDFSLATFSKLLDKAGIFAGRGLYNATAEDYRALIACWSAHVGPPPPKPAKQLATDEYVARISDPAIRSLVTGLIVERNKLKARFNTLSAATRITVDRRPVDVVKSNGGEGSAIVLTASERAAVAKAISPTFLAAQGLREVDIGEVVNKTGRTVYDPGYATALRKLLGSADADDSEGNPHSERKRGRI